MNDKIPAALASIKRYSIVYGGEFTQPRFELVEDREGEVMKAADVLATLPPPADEAVAWQMRTNYGNAQGWSDWFSCSEGQFNLWKEFPRDYPNAECRALYAAPPADSAMVEALRKLIESWRGDQSDHMPSNEMMSRWRCADQLELTLLAGRK